MRVLRTSVASFTIEVLNGRNTSAMGSIVWGIVTGHRPIDRKA
jgi:hypothetical protein